MFQHKQIHKTTWTSPDGRTENQIHHITIERKWRRSLLDVRVKQGADAGSDHHLVVADLKVYGDRVDNPTNTTYTVAGRRDMKRLYEITRTLSGKNKAPSRPVKDKNGETITDEAKEKARWAEHFQEILNRPPPQVPPDIPPAGNQLEVNTNPPTKAKVSKAIIIIKVFIENTVNNRRV